ncbi:hypothetical protein INT47_004580 [Mucor saturninus]|uniref:FAR1 domain-containing protein n=1 Tax=Mucor saturninus TaxID=64648 RepID=A0A8H7RJV0_9FUNG|nr:hypothetical protein INT47_004580 [Mucor saturninus]
MTEKTGPINSQPITNEIETVLQRHMASYNENMTGFVQQTLIDVNSQPLVPAPAISLRLPTPEIKAELSPKPTIEMDKNSPILVEFYETFPTGQVFDSLASLRSTALEYGKKYNVALTTSKSDKTKVYLICKHGGYYRKNIKKATSPDKPMVKTRIRKSLKNGCSCLIYARYEKKGDFWTVRKSIGEHNHPIAEDPRTYAMYRSLEPEHLAFVHKQLKDSVCISDIVRSLIESGVKNIVSKDIENIQQDLKRKQAKAMAVAVALP